MFPPSLVQTYLWRDLFVVSVPRICPPAPVILVAFDVRLEPVTHWPARCPWEVEAGALSTRVSRNTSKSHPLPTWKFNLPRVCLPPGVCWDTEHTAVIQWGSLPVGLGQPWSHIQGQLSLQDSLSNLTLKQLGRHYTGQVFYHIDNIYMLSHMIKY